MADVSRGLAAFRCLQLNLAGGLRISGQLRPQFLSACPIPTVFMGSGSICLVAQASQAWLQFAYCAEIAPAWLLRWLGLVRVARLASVLSGVRPSLLFIYSYVFLSLLLPSLPLHIGRKMKRNSAHKHQGYEHPPTFWCTYFVDIYGLVVGACLFFAVTICRNFF